MQSFSEVTIVGGNILGCALALALAKSGFNVKLLEASDASPNWQEDNYDYRVSAITLASQHFLSYLGIWDKVADRRISPFKRIEVWEQDHSQVLQFDANTISENYLGFIVENNLLHHVLLDELAKIDTVQIEKSIHLTGLSHADDKVFVYSDSGKTFETQLLIGCDGRKSWVRQHVPIKYQERAYEQLALVATLHTEYSHQQKAIQVFSPSSILAFLPLKDEHLSSIVWSVNMDKAKVLQNLNEEAFCAALKETLNSHLGELTLVSERKAFPLYQLKADRYIAERAALVGDSVHTVHPLAGQGINLGLQDISTLTEVLTAAKQKKQDIGSHKTLRRYERLRRGDNFLMTTAIDAIKTLFESKETPILRLRQWGMGMVNQLTPLQVFFTLHATGFKSDNFKRLKSFS